ncbi:MAG: WbqC family protein [Flavicella sp.]
MILVHPTYFSPIAQYAAIYGGKKIVFEFEDNYQKQTYRNRCYIGGANGKQLLNIPVKHNKTSEKTKTKDIEIDYDTSIWYKKHLKSLQSAYRGSPFYEYYEHDIIDVFKKKHKFLIDLNIDIHHFVMEVLQQESSFIKTKQFNLNSPYKDLRQLCSVKKENAYNFPKYTQMFDDKHGFQQNLSILDLLFMEGPTSYKYLQFITKTTP